MGIEIENIDSPVQVKVSTENIDAIVNRIVVLMGWLERYDKLIYEKYNRTGYDANTAFLADNRWIDACEEFERLAFYLDRHHQLLTQEHILNLLPTILHMDDDYTKLIGDIILQVIDPPGSAIFYADGCTSHLHDLKFNLLYESPDSPYVNDKEMYRFSFALDTPILYATDVLSIIDRINNPTAVDMDNLMIFLLHVTHDFPDLVQYEDRIVDGLITSNYNPSGEWGTGGGEDRFLDYARENKLHKLEKFIVDRENYRYSQRDNK